MGAFSLSHAVGGILYGRSLCVFCMCNNVSYAFIKEVYVCFVCVCPCSKKFVGTCMYSCSLAFHFDDDGM